MAKLTACMTTKRRTPQQMKVMRKDYVKNFMSGMTKNDAARAAGFSPSMAANAAHRIETPEVRDEIRNLQKALLAEIPTSLFVEKFREGLAATTVKTARKDGKFTDEREFPDYRIRLRYLEKIASMSGLDQSKTVAPPTNDNAAPINLKALTNEELRERRERLERQLGIDRNRTDGTACLPAPGGAGEVSTE
jgi:hypothetical protein